MVKYFQATPITIKINGNPCCCFEEEKFQLKGMDKIPGNRRNVVENEIAKQLNNLIDKYHSPIAQKIQICLQN